jgi:hypothetical protein
VENSDEKLSSCFGAAMKQYLVASCLIGMCSGSCANIETNPNGSGIDERGYWVGEAAIAYHLVDRHLAPALAYFFLTEEAKSVADFGCGTGEYTRIILDHGIDCKGYDGNPDTPQITQGLCEVLDLSQETDLQQRFDWVMSLEVGEHLPKQYERIFIENLDRHSVKGIVLSWAIEGQGGLGHYNEQNNDYIKKVMADYGYENDVEAENGLRKSASFRWFKNTIMVFRKSGI